MKEEKNMCSNINRSHKERKDSEKKNEENESTCASSCE